MSDDHVESGNPDPTPTATPDAGSIGMAFQVELWERNHKRRARIDRGIPYPSNVELQHPEEETIKEHRTSRYVTLDRGMKLPVKYLEVGESVLCTSASRTTTSSYSRTYGASFVIGLDPDSALFNNRNEARDRIYRMWRVPTRANVKWGRPTKWKLEPPVKLSQKATAEEIQEGLLWDWDYVQQMIDRKSPQAFMMKPGDEISDFPHLLKDYIPMINEETGKVFKLRDNPAHPRKMFLKRLS